MDVMELLDDCATPRERVSIGLGSNSNCLYSAFNTVELDTSRTLFFQLHLRLNVASDSAMQTEEVERTSGVIF